MAKIYETQKDLEREKVAEQIKEAQSNQKVFAGAGAVFALLSVLYLRVHELGEELLSHSGNTKKLVWGNDGIKGWAAAIGAAGAVTMALIFNKRTNTLRKEAENLGPQNTILPKRLAADLPNESNLDNYHVERLEKSRANLESAPSVQL